MKPLPHQYDARLAGGPDGYAELSTPGVPPLRTAPPPEYGGPGDAWSPEHLFLASLEACFLFTLRAVARAAKLAFTTLDVEVNGVVDRQERVTRFTSLRLRPTLMVPAGTSRDLALRVLEKSHAVCLVSASLSTPVHFDPVVVEAAVGEPAVS